MQEEDDLNTKYENKVRESNEGGEVEMRLFGFITHRVLYSEYSGRKHNLHFFVSILFVFCSETTFYSFRFGVFPIFSF